MSSSDTDDSYSSSSSHSDHRRSKRKKKHKRSKDDTKHKKRRHREHKKHKSKHKEKSKSKSKHKHKHKHKEKSKHDRDKQSGSKKRKRTEAESSDSKQQDHKKRKLSQHPCTKQMIKNAKTVLNMLCENDSDDAMKHMMLNVFRKLDNQQSVSLHEYNASMEQPLKMIFTFLALRTNDEITYYKANSVSLLETFKKQLKLQTPRKSETDVSANKPPATFIGPAMPPANYQRTKPATSSVPITETNVMESTNSGIIGVTMPTKSDLLNNRYSSDEDEDIVGPANVHNTESATNSDCKRLLQMEHTRIYAEMNKEIQGDDENAGDGQSKNEEKRAEWMTSMPQSVISDFDKGTKGRGFSQKEHKLDESWQQTPGDLKKQKKERKRIQQIQERTNEKLRAIGLPTVDERNDNDTLTQPAERNMGEADENESGDRKKSLFEIHQEKLKQQYKQELKEWKRRKKNGEKVGAKPVFKGVEMHDANTNYTGSMHSYYNAQNPVFTRSKLNTFVSGGSIDNY